MEMEFKVLQAVKQTEMIFIIMKPMTIKTHKTLTTYRKIHRVIIQKIIVQLNQNRVKFLSQLITKKNFTPMNHLKMVKKIMENMSQTLYTKPKLLQNLYQHWMNLQLLVQSVNPVVRQHRLFMMKKKK
ncbi:hypothetical protein COBT_001014 [Conglomerata obtusa]